MLKELILKNRSCRGYAQTPRPTEEELKELADCARLCPSASNRQPLRCRLVNDQAECAALQAATRWGGALRELHLPYPGTEATALLVLCYDSASAKDSPMLRIDTGIAAQTVLLRATEMGYSGLMIAAFEPDGVKRALTLPEGFEPVLVIALGKGAETIVLEDRADGEERAYWRDEKGVHHVPKVPLEKFIIR